jgi:hypothetical protein
VFASLPILLVERPVLHRFGDVFGLDLLAPAEVGVGAADLQDAIMGAGDEV